jgi:predicted anti-sigma-YlaC factor YlaD
VVEYAVVLSINQREGVMSNIHQQTRDDFDRASRGEPMLDYATIRAHTRECDKCKAYFNKLAWQGRARENLPEGEASTFERTVMGDFFENILLPNVIPATRWRIAYWDVRNWCYRWLRKWGKRLGLALLIIVIGLVIISI